MRIRRKAIKIARMSDDWLATAHALADRAREVSLRWFRTPLAVDLKADHSPVTEADRRIEAMCREQLAVRYPSHGIVGEEFGSVAADAEFVWLIDPIDGTLSFISGLPLWGTLIALLQRGQPVLGLIDTPATDERWSATRGDMAMFRAAGKSPQACLSSGCDQLSLARLCAPSPDTFVAEQADAFRRLSAQVAIRRHGGDCYAYGLLASGFLDLVVETGLAPHDHLPLVPVIEAAGGVISDWSGLPLGLHSTGDVVAAASAELHRQALAALAS
jgi:histidinol phosphatase-like enzyme (inositol monophosphatase family)